MLMAVTTRYNKGNIKSDKARSAIPGLFFEIAYFVAFLYLRVLPTFGIYAGSATAGMLMVGVAGLIVLNQLMNKGAVSVSLAAIVIPAAISASIWVIALTTHPEFWQQSNYFFISTLPLWVSESLIISYLLRRPGFIKRLLLLMFLTVLAIMSFARIDNDHRLTLATGGFLANSNDFGAWVAFCALCFAMWAFGARHFAQRLLFIVLSIISFGLVALTVSRASMFLGLGALALFILARLLILKRSLSTIVTVLVGALAIVLLASSFNIDSLTASYSQRFDEDTGRDRLWATAFPLVLDNPLGVGSLYIYDPGFKRLIGPHNVFLYLGLAGGWTPVILLFVYYLIAAKRMPKRTLYDGFLWVPALFVFVFLEHNQSNEYIFHLWSVITLCLCMMPPETPSIPDPLKTSPRLTERKASL